MVTRLLAKKKEVKMKGSVAIACAPKPQLPEPAPPSHGGFLQPPRDVKIEQPDSPQEGYGPVAPRAEVGSLRQDEAEVPWGCEIR